MTGGVSPAWTAVPSGERSPRKKGLIKGLFIFLLTFLIVPLTAIISAAAGMRPWLVAISAVLLLVGGLLRMAYALMFESVNPENFSDPARVPAHLLRAPVGPASLPAGSTIPASTYVGPPAAGHWRDTSDLEPRSVTEGTTKLLEKESEP
jgi:hypothetical protein